MLSMMCASCGSGTDQDKGKATPTPSQDVLAVPTIDRTFVVEPGARHLALRCSGRGAPAIILEVGTDSSGLEDFADEFIRPMAEKHMTCVYDRTGTGSSDPPNKKRRSLDDVVSDLSQLLTAAKIRGPYLLVGSSGGANIVVQYAMRHKDNVAGLVLLDISKPIPNLDEEFPGPLGWKNPEHIDWVRAERSQSKIKGPIGDFPVLVVTADQGDSDRKDQSFWLRLSPRARQIVMRGGHDIHEDLPDDVAKEVLSVAGGH
jgi:pimeloyl-ACP methyl ester carboxylesterase